jgi:hypothetical protein
MVGNYPSRWILKSEHVGEHTLLVAFRPMAVCPSYSVAVAVKVSRVAGAARCRLCKGGSMAL